MHKILEIIFPKRYFVFRRFAMVDSFSNSNGAEIEERFALHFVEPFRTKRKANKAIKTAKVFQPWQEFIILKS